MSYYIYFRVKVEGTDNYISVWNCEANITWNVREVIKASTGLPWVNCEDNGFRKDVMPHIEKGLEELKNHPEKYKKYEAPNGWGAVKGAIRFFDRILFSWQEFVKCTDEEIVNITRFWIY